MYSRQVSTQYGVRNSPVNCSKSIYMYNDGTEVFSSISVGLGCRVAAAVVEAVPALLRRTLE